MLKLNYQRKTHYLGAVDTQAIATIMDKYGLSTASDAVRLAVRLTAESPTAQLSKKRGKTA